MVTFVGAPEDEKAKKLKRVADQNAANITQPIVNKVASTGGVAPVTTPSIPKPMSEQSFVGGNITKDTTPGSTNTELGGIPNIPQPLSTTQQQQIPEVVNAQDQLVEYQKKEADTKQKLVDAQTNQQLAGAVDVVKKNQEAKDYMQQQQATNQAITDRQNASANIVSTQNIKNAQTQLNNLRQNLAYLGSGGKPGRSAVQLDAVAKQQADAETTFRQIQELESNKAEVQRLGGEFDSRAFSRRMKELQDDLDNKVSRVVQDAITGFTQDAADIDTIEELNQVRDRYLDSVDSSLEGVTQRQVQQRTMLNDEYKALVTDQKEYLKNKNTVSKELSQAQGYYVDGNGQPVISATTGTTIPMPQDAPMDPIFDKGSGKLISFSTGPDGKIVADVQQIIDQPTFEMSTISNYASLVAQGKIDIKDVPEQVRNSSSFVNSLANTQFSTPATEQSERKLNSTTGEYYRTGPNNELQTANSPTDVTETDSLAGKSVSNTILSGGVEALASTMQEGVPYEVDPSREQCGERYNDSVGIKNDTRVGDSYTEKTKFIDSTLGKPGDAIVFNPGGTYAESGHIGVVASGPYERDGVIGYDMISSNYDQKGKLSKKFVSEDLIASSGGGFITTKAKEDPRPVEKASKPLTDKQFTQSNQIITSFKGDPQVKAFEEAYSQNLNLLESLKDASGPGDVAAVFQFMKTLDPNSTVREGEFDTAAKSAGVTQYLGNTFERLSKGEKLTPEQRKAFGTLATQFIKNKSKLYQTKYKDGMRRLEQQGIDTSVFPTNIADELTQYVGDTDVPISDDELYNEVFG